MCTLYSHTRAVEAMRQLFAPQPFDGRGTNTGPQPAIYPDTHAIVVADSDGTLVTEMARFGLPTPAQYLRGKDGRVLADKGVTNVRNTASPHWRQWLGPANRCLVPFDRFAEPRAGGGQVWFDLAPGVAGFFAGIVVRGWTSVRKAKDGPTTDTVYGFLTCAPNAVVAPHHGKAMPVILTEKDEWETWLHAPWEVARLLQRPLRDDLLRVVSGS
jgi:putative SOS response-associated peptidase YedK